MRHLEKFFFDEEDSEKEEQVKAKMSKDMMSGELTSMDNQTLKQLWCIPLSVNVKEFDFDYFSEQQKKLGGRLFDVITIDPPW